MYSGNNGATNNAVPVRYSWFETTQKNKPQSNSIGGAAMMLFASGIHLAYGSWSPFISLGPQFVIVYVSALCVFHLAAIVGSWVGAVVVDRWTKRTINYCCGVFLIAGNVIFMIWYDGVAIIAGRILVGLAHGCIYIALICHGGENSVNEMRGRVVSIAGMMLSLAAFSLVMANISLDYSTVISSNLLVGVISLILTLVGLLFTPCLTYESVVFLIQRGQHEQALQNMTKLRNEFSPTIPIHNDFTEIKRYVEEESTKKMNIFKEGNARPLTLVTGVRILTFISNNVLLNGMMWFFTGVLFNQTNDTMWIGSIILTGVRMVFALAPAFVGDTLGRKTFIYISAGVGGLVLLVVAIVLSAVSFTIDGVGYVAIGFLVCQALFGFGLDATPHVVASEAFALRKKAMSIAFVESVFHALHIITLVLVYEVNDGKAVRFTMLFIPAVLLIVLTIAINWWLPETRTMSLSQCRNEYMGGVHIGETYSKENLNSQDRGITYGA